MSAGLLRKVAYIRPVPTRGAEPLPWLSLRRQRGSVRSAPVDGWASRVLEGCGWASRVLEGCARREPLSSEATA